MAKIAVLLAITILGFLLWQELKKSPPERRRQLLLRGSFFALIGIILILAATGRVHWIMAAIAAALPFIKILFGILLRGLPFLQVWRKYRQTGQEQSNQKKSSPPQTSSEITKEEAWQLLGLEPHATREEITQAHKRLIQKVHPDRGGNDYLAAKLNAARDLLLG
jgi:DnaJ homolog subfamily C member 19